MNKLFNEIKYVAKKQTPNKQAQLLEIRQKQKKNIFFVMK